MRTASLAPRVAGLALLSASLAFTVSPRAQTTIALGIGTQNTTTNTVTGGIVLKELGLLEKHLPKTGKYAGVKYNISWQNATSGPPITNGMMADNIQIGMMGDYPLLVNGATGQATGNETQLVAVIAYNAVGGGNGIVVPKDSPYYELGDLKGKTVSVPFGSAAHGMMLQALQSRGLPATFWNLVSQSPEVGSTNLQEKRIDAHGDFVPFAELLPFRGIARKIYDGAETGQPTFHGVVVRKDFGEKYPEIVVAYIKAMMEANEWLRKNPKEAAEKIASWTRIDKEVAYIFLGPGGIHTLDPTIKPRWVEALKADYGVLKKLNMIKDLDIAAWVNDSYVRSAYQESGLDYGAQLASFSNYVVRGKDPVCGTAVSRPEESGQIWVRGGDILPFSSAACTLAGVKQLTAEGKQLDAVYLVDRTLGIKVFADAAFYTLGGDPKKPRITPYLLKRDAEADAGKNGGKLAGYAEALAAAGSAER
ncbi:Putative aliphatic sulfonates-binding protein precursor [Pigmentiphaga humi]|uniref:Putative aliphatic sulfonates-binding protein n=1 Tax=Pigmentiphaga humi TaxID=2478468 RepID=A0A3P4B9N5_9BURK|nr:ABC transporter substrate-binding protein [Pigmentiphaga humi]VCU72236.1 Putative aliphatic sulfonates-binding protein precursor [Pigmentiphaga humi]